MIHTIKSHDASFAPSLVWTSVLCAVFAVLVMFGFAGTENAWAIGTQRINDYNAQMTSNVDIYINRSKVTGGNSQTTVNSSKGIIIHEADNTLGRRVMYKGNATGVLDIDNAYKVRYLRVGATASGDPVDLIIECTHVTFDANTDKNIKRDINYVCAPQSIGYELFNIAGGPAFAVGDFAGVREEDGTFTWDSSFSSCRVTQTVKMYCVKAGTDTVVQGRFSMYLFDLDTVDGSSIPVEWSNAWAESVRLISGISEPVYISTNTVLDLTKVNSENRFMATTGTDSLESTPSIWDSGIVFRSDLNGVVTLSWGSGGCGIATSLGFGAAGDIKGSISITKKDYDFNSFVNQGNGLLPGTEFTVFRDADCTDSLGIKVVIGSDGVGTSGAVLPLANNPYYIKETKAPVGYNLNPDKIMMIAKAT